MNDNDKIDRDNLDRLYKLNSIAYQWKWGSVC